MSRTQPTFHDAIAKLLEDFPEPMASAEELQRANVEQDLYRQGKGSGAHPPAKQFMSRARKYPALFRVLPQNRIQYIGE
jgi:hypothetical protein